MTKGMDLNENRLTNPEKAALTRLRREVNQWDHLSNSQKKWLDDRCLIRYLRARKLDIKKAKEMLMNTMDWRVDHKPHRVPHTTVYPIATALSSYFHLHDDHGHPICYMRFNRDPANFTPAEKIRYIMFQQEEAIRLFDQNKERFPHADKCVFIIDLDAFSMSAPGADTGIARKWGDMLSNHYPERLYKAYLINYPTIFSMFWTVVSAFMEKAQTDKVRWVSHTDKAKLREYFQNEGFHPERLEQEYGGDVDPLSRPNLIGHEEYHPEPMSPVTTS